MRIGIVGLPSSGKTTLFQSIANVHLDESALRREANQAIVKVPDKRLNILSDMFNPKKTTLATIELVDLAAQPKKVDGNTQFSTNFLSMVKTYDALLFVVRGFNDELMHTGESFDFIKDINTLESEFILSDMAQVESRIEKLNKAVQKLNDESAKTEISYLSKWLDALQNEIPLRNMDFTPEEDKYLKNYSPISAKPTLLALNLDENEIQNSKKYIDLVMDKIKGKNIKISSFSAKIEMELAHLPEEDSATFMADYGIEESALNRLIRDSYDLLGLQSFFTVGEDECRAWTIRKGMTAPEAAGEIHSDFYKSFIRAEVVSYNDFIENQTFPKCKEKGVWRLEGKEYIVKDGDIMSIRHS